MCCRECFREVLKSWKFHLSFFILMLFVLTGSFVTVLTYIITGDVVIEGYVGFYTFIGGITFLFCVIAKIRTFSSTRKEIIVDPAIVGIIVFLIVGTSTEGALIFCKDPTSIDLIFSAFTAATVAMGISSWGVYITLEDHL